MDFRAKASHTASMTPRPSLEGRMEWQVPRTVLEESSLSQHGLSGSSVTQALERDWELLPSPTPAQSPESDEPGQALGIWELGRGNCVHPCSCHWNAWWWSTHREMRTISEDVVPRLATDHRLCANYHAVGVPECSCHSGEKSSKVRSSESTEFKSEMT